MEKKKIQGNSKQVIKLRNKRIKSTALNFTHVSRKKIRSKTDCNIALKNSSSQASVKKTLGWTNEDHEKEIKSTSGNVAVRQDRIKVRSTKSDKEKSFSKGKTGPMKEGNLAAKIQETKEQLPR